MNCPYCDAPIEPFDRFCENCGANLKPASPASGESVPSSPSPSGVAQRSPVQDIDPKIAESVMAAAAEVGKAYQAQNMHDAASPRDPYTRAAHSQAPYGPTSYGGYTSNENTAPATPFVLAIVGLVIGCVGLLTFGIGAFIAPLGIIFGIIALVMRSSYRKLDAYDKHESSTLVLGICGIVTNVLAMIVLTALIVFGMALSEYDGYTYQDDTAIEELVGQVNS